jgi:hypothetical protein
MISMNKSDNANLPCANGINIHQSHKADQEKSEFSNMSEKNPGNLNGSIAYWNSRYLDLYCMTENKQKNPTFFVTFTQNDRWPELQRLIKYVVKEEFLQTTTNDWFEREFANQLREFWMQFKVNLASASIDADAYSPAGCIKYCNKDAVLSASKNYYFMQIVF